MKRGSIGAAVFLQVSYHVAALYLIRVTVHRLFCSLLYVIWIVHVVCSTACQPSDGSQVESQFNGGVVNGDVIQEASAVTDLETAKDNPEDGFRVDKREETEQISRTEEVVERPDGSEEVMLKHAENK